MNQNHKQPETPPNTLPCAWEWSRRPWRGTGKGGEGKWREPMMSDECWHRWIGYGERRWGKGAGEGEMKGGVRTKPEKRCLCTVCPPAWLEANKRACLSNMCRNSPVVASMTWKGLGSSSPRQATSTSLTFSAWPRCINKGCTPFSWLQAAK